MVKKAYLKAVRLANTSASRYQFDRMLPRIIRKTLGRDSGFRVLDVGCGRGEYSSFFPGGEYVGIDVGDYEFRRDLTENSSFCRASSMELPFEDNTFDIAFSSFMLEHIEEPERALAEVKRVLKPSGWILFSTGTDWSEPVGEMHSLFWKEEDDFIGQAHHYFRPEELRGIHERAGYADINLRYVGGPAATMIDVIRTFFRFFWMKAGGRRYTHGRDSDETGKEKTEKPGLPSRLIRALWVVFSYPFRWLLYKFSLLLDMPFASIKGRFVIIEARKEAE